MVEIKPRRIKYFSSEDECFPAKNILNFDLSKCWKCKNKSDQQLILEIELETPTKIGCIEIANCGSAFIEIQVLNKQENSDDYQILLVSTSIMTVMDSIKNQNLYHIRTFSKQHFTNSVLIKEWDIIKIMCRQPFNKTIQYGLASVRIFNTLIKDVECILNMSTDNLNELNNRIDVNNLNNLPKENLNDTQPLFIPTNKTISSNDVLEEVENNQTQILLEDTQVLNNETERIVDPSPKSISNSQQTQNLTPDTLVLDMNTGMIVKSSKNKILNSQPTLSNPCKAKFFSSNICTKPSSNTSETLKLSVNNDNSINTTNPTNLETENRDSAIQSNHSNAGFNEVMSGVTFVLSGYQNPLRDSIRRKAIDMGAKYKPNWDRTCTHLICAFTNTPKYKQVHDQAIIVNENWIIDSYNKQQKMNCLHYKLDNSSSTISKSNNNCNDNDTIIVTNNKRKLLDDQTDDDSQDIKHVTEIKSKLRRIESSDDEDNVDNLNDHSKVNNSNNITLPDIFNGKHFLLYGKFDEDDRKYIRRMLIAFGGTLHSYMNSEVEIVITHSRWDSNFDEAIAEFSHLLFIDPLWVDACDQARQMVNLDGFIITKQ